jgi:hypothetical protein
MEYAQQFEAFAREHPDLAAGLEEVQGLGGVMEWMKSRGLALDSMEVINQDEFSLDVVIPLADWRHLAFGIT